MTSLQAWLNDDSARRNIFVVATVRNMITGTDVPVYLSNCHFITTDLLTVFKPIISGNFSVSERLDIEGGYSVSYGDIELFNNDGELDTWLDSTLYVWVNRAILVYVGDSSWTCSSAGDIASVFHLVFDGVIADIDCKSLTRLSLKVRDKSQRLNATVSEELIGIGGMWNGVSPNLNRIKPLVLGEVHNIEPILIDPAAMQYMFSSGESESLIEIRDNGVPIYTAEGITEGLLTGAEVDLAGSTFTLTHPPVGQLTVSVRGRKLRGMFSGGITSITTLYGHSIASIIAILCVSYGTNTGDRLAASEIDATSFQEVGDSGSASAGIYLGTDAKNVMEVCKQLADSVGGHLFFSRQGKLQLIRVGTYTSVSAVDITESDIVLGSLTVTNRISPKAATRLAYCKNWTVQEGLETGIPDKHKEMFSTEWYYASYANNTVKELYRLHSEVATVETFLVSAGAPSMAVTMNEYHNTSRTVYAFTGKASTLSVEVGQQVTLFHHRFNLWNSGSGTPGQVLSVSPDWVGGTNRIEVIV